jgi:hypothetical protein
MHVTDYNNLFFLLNTIGHYNIANFPILVTFYTLLCYHFFQYLAVLVMIDDLYCIFLLLIQDLFATLKKLLSFAFLSFFKIFRGCKLKIVHNVMVDVLMKLTLCKLVLKSLHIFKNNRCQVIKYTIVGCFPPLYASKHIHFESIQH